MNRSWLTGLLAGLVVFAAVLALTGALWAQGAPPPTGRVASIDIGMAIAEYQRWKDATEELQQHDQNLKLEEEQRRTRIDALQATVEAMDRNDPTYLKKMSEVLEAKIEYGTWGQVQQAHTSREFALVTDRVYQDILHATAEIARQAGYDLVVYFDQYQRVSINPDEVRAQVLSRRVIYANAAVDITQLVLDKLNADYRAQPRTPQIYIP